MSDAKPFNIETDTKVIGTITNAFPPLHAKLSPSSSDRWLACPASIVRAPETEDEGSEAAHEGTAAHAFAAYCLETRSNAMTASFPIKYKEYDDPDLRMHIQTYYDYVMRLVAAGGELFIEQRLEIFKQYEVFGTADAIVVMPDGVIHVIDLKFGKGILVDVEENSQLLLYGVGGLAFDWLSKVPVHTISVHIVQPRRNNLVSKTYSVDELGQWVVENTPRVAAAFVGTNIASPGTHCKWCPIKGTCRERAEANLALASFDFEDAGPGCVDHSMLTEPEIVKIYLNIKTFRNWLDDIEAETARRAHDHAVDGLKWVAGRVARKIVDPITAAKELKRVGIEPFDEPKMIGITAIETALKLKGLKVVDVLGKAVEVIAGKPALVSALDKREPLTETTSAVVDFT